MGSHHCESFRTWGVGQMGQKVHPTGIRLGITKDHNSIWYAGKDKYADNLLTDISVRTMVEQRLEKASVSKVVIERPAQNAKVTIHTARPGIVIGKKGEDVEVLTLFTNHNTWTGSVDGYFGIPM